MKRLKMKLLSLMLIIAMLSSMLGITTFAQHGSEATDNGSVTLDTVIDLLCDKYQGTSDFWKVISFVQIGRKDLINQQAVIENAALIGKDEEAPVTEIEKAAIALTAIGIDASNFDDNGEKINFIQQIADNEGLDLLINAQIFALIAVDSGNYNTPEGGRTKETLIQSILDKKCDGGGWAFSGDVADPDLTGMAILALAPYYESDVNVKNSLDEAVNILSNMQLEDGGFESYGTKNSISTATVLSALTAFGINPYSDQRFIKNGNTAIEALMSYYIPDTGFGLNDNINANSMADDFALLALATLKKYDDGSSYIFRFERKQEDSEPKTVSIRIEGNNKTIVPKTEVTVENFDLTAYGAGNTNAPNMLHAIIKALKSQGFSPVDDGSLVGINSEYGYFISSIGHVASEGNNVWMYAVNNQDPGVGVTDYLLCNGDNIVLYYYDWSIAGYSWFDKELVEIEEDESFDLKLTIARYGQEDSPVSGAVILSNEGVGYSPEVETNFVTDENGIVEITFSNPGTYLLSAVRKDAQTQGIDISRPYCKVVVNEKEESGDDDGKGGNSGGGGDSSYINVTVSVKGNSAKGMILQPKTVSIEKGESVFDAVSKVLAANGISFKYTGKGANIYISSIDGLSEFDEGSTSGWVYYVNGKKPSISMGEYIPKNNDIIKLEYSKEEKTSGGSVGAGGGAATYTQTETRTDYKEAKEKLLNTIKEKDEITNWEAFGLLLNAVEVSEKFWQKLASVMEENEGQLSRVTDYAAMALVLKSAGKDITDFAGYNIAEIIYNNEEIGRQGVNGYIFPLIVLNNLQVPSDAKWNVDLLIDELLKYQNEDGGFSLDLNGKSSVDLTAMALSALAPYKDRAELKSVIENAISYLIKEQKSDGTHGFEDEKTCESTAQIIIALSELGIDAEDNRFVKNNKNLIDILLSYQKSNGTFSHTMGADSDLMASEQALLALTAYSYYKGGKGSIYSSAPVNNKEEINNFKDMDKVSDWAKDFVIKAKEMGIVAGNQENEIKPQDMLTRAEFVTMILRAMNLEPTDKYQPIFEDIKENDWFWQYVLKAKELNIIQGIAPNSFEPNDMITREDMAVIIARAYNFTADEITNEITDMENVSDYAKNAVSSLYKEGIMQGDDQRMFSPKAFTTREMAIVVMVRLAQS